MASKVNKYQIFCETEGEFVPSDEWRTTPITTCPHNVAHVVKDGSVEIIEQRDQISRAA